jgi:hypothetical protein
MSVGVSVCVWMWEWMCECEWVSVGVWAWVWVCVWVWMWVWVWEWVSEWVSVSVWAWVWVWRFRTELQLMPELLRYRSTWILRSVTVLIRLWVWLVDLRRKKLLVIQLLIRKSVNTVHFLFFIPAIFHSMFQTNKIHYLKHNTLHIRCQLQHVSAQSCLLQGVFFLENDQLDTKKKKYIFRIFCVVYLTNCCNLPTAVISTFTRQVQKMSSCWKLSRKIRHSHSCHNLERFLQRFTHKP